MYGSNDTYLNGGRIPWKKPDFMPGNVKNWWITLIESHLFDECEKTIFFLGLGLGLGPGPGFNDHFQLSRRCREAKPWSWYHTYRYGWIFVQGT
jgi:hypothetical protein